MKNMQNTYMSNPMRNNPIRNVKTHIHVRMDHTSCPLIPRLATFFLLAFLFLLPWKAFAQSGKDGRTIRAETDYRRIEGKWLRPDGGYVLKLSDVTSEGTLKAAYYNPRPINVGKAEWQRIDERIQVFVKLQDVNYPGSTYRLIYKPEHDRLYGYYFQAVTKETFEVIFVRKD